VFGVEPPKPAAYPGGAHVFGGGLFGYSPIVSVPPPSIFSAPLPTTSTAHLFGGAYYTAPPARKAPEKK